MTEFLIAILANVVLFVTFPVCFNMADELYYILNILWARKLNHNKNSRQVRPIANSQSVYTVRYVLTRWDMKQTVSSA